MAAEDDARIMRERLASLEAALEAEPVPDTAAAVVGQTYTRTTYPTAAQRVYAMKVVDISGTENEGATPTLTASSRTFEAINLGATIPPSGTNVPCFQTGGYWWFRYG